MTVYFHELGHSFFGFYYGCKENLFVVTIDPFLVNSNDGPYIEGCWENLSKIQQANIAFGGLLSSGLFGTLFLTILRKYKIKNLFILLLLLFLGIFNFLELISYLIAGPFDKLKIDNNLYSDVPLIVEKTGINPNLIFIVGIFLTILVWYAYQKLNLSQPLKISNKIWRIFFSITYIFLLAVLIFVKLLI